MKTKVKKADKISQVNELNLEVGQDVYLYISGIGNSEHYRPAKIVYVTPSGKIDVEYIVKYHDGSERAVKIRFPSNGSSFENHTLTKIITADQTENVAKAKLYIATLKLKRKADKILETLKTQKLSMEKTQKAIEQLSAMEALLAE